MTKRNLRSAEELIGMLESGSFSAVCPCCGDAMRLRDAGMFFEDHFTEDAEQLYQQMIEEQKKRLRELKARRQSAQTTSETGAKSVNIGKVLERLAPAFEDFSFERNDCRSLFDPIDYVIFEGLSRKGTVERIIFSDVKTGSARLKSHQREIRDLVENKKLDWDTYEREK